jgi:hypothetical protein
MIAVVSRSVPLAGLTACRACVGANTYYVRAVAVVVGGTVYNSKQASLRTFDEC